MREWAVLLAVICLASSAWGQEERPLRTDNAELVGIGVIQTGFGVEFLHKARYSLSRLEGDLMRFGVTEMRIGVGEYAEFQISGVFRDFLSVTQRTPPVIPSTFAGDTTSDFGDLILGVKLRLVPERGQNPAVSFKFAVQLPNASNESGLGTDESEFYSSALVSKHLGRLQLLGNVGLAILGSPVQPNSQADQLTYGCGVLLSVHPKLELVGEVHGRRGPPRVGNENLSQVQLGARFRAAGMRWDVAGLAGLEHFSPGSGLMVGVTFEFQAFHRKRTPTTIRQEKGKLPETENRSDR